MNRILLVTSSPRGAASYSTRIASLLAKRLASGDPGAVHVRDLNRDPVAHIDEHFVVGRDSAPQDRTPAQRAAIERSDHLIKELFAADVIVIASAMVNFSLSSNLKAWVDHLVRAGVTFRYTDTGPEGLVKDKKVYLVKASGGVYSEGPMASYNFQDTYLKRILGFIGLTDIEVIPIEGTAFGVDAAEKAFSLAEARVASIPPYPLAAAS